MLNKDAQAIFLLTYKHSKSELIPLSAQEYSRIAYQIRDKGLSGPKDLFELTDSEIISSLGIDESLAKRISGLLDLGGTASLYLEGLLNQGIQVITRTDQVYPLAFKSLLRENTPPYLSYVGNIGLLSEITESCVISASDLPRLKQTKHKVECRNLACIVDSSYHVKCLEKGIRYWDTAIVFSSIGLNKLIQQPSVRESIRERCTLILSTNIAASNTPNYHSLYLYLMAFSVLNKGEIIHSAQNTQITKILDLIQNGGYLQGRFSVFDHQTIGSKTIVKQVSRLEDSQLTDQKLSKPDIPAITIYTIGHSNHDIEKFIQLLEMHEIDMLVDVRSAPSSKYATQYDQKSLKDSLKDTSIQYKYMGKSLGGRPKDKDVLSSEGKIVRENIEQKDWYKQGIQELIEMSKKHGKVAFMCSEEDPTHCHRGYVVSNTLIEMGIKVLHIRGTGDAQELGLLNSPTDQMEIQL